MSKAIKEQRRFRFNKPYPFSNYSINVVYYKVRTLVGYAAIGTYGKNISVTFYESLDENAVDHVMLRWLSNNYYGYDNIKFI